MKYHAVVLAGGTGERFGVMKQFVPLDGKPIFIRTLQKFASDVNCKLTLVIPAQFHDVVDNCLNHYNVMARVVTGGDTRQASVYNALQAIQESDYWGPAVLITDSNRPLITESTIQRCLETIQSKDCLAALTVCKSINTPCTSSDGLTLQQILKRDTMYELLMPQVFDLSLLHSAHTKTKLVNASDDMQVIISTFPKVRAKLVHMSLWEGLKLTYPEDYKIFEVLL
jgi:2-C-methyl-D-erythritol 4-phosphate cytidylyltransferase